ncbi:MAG TPA: hypothetical protein VM935_17045 [Chitinophagaceae bacterium]|nr:hypothetical protein [Chitinophagaceae bacterium]
MQKNILALAITGLMLFGCEKTKTFNALSDSIPANAVIVSNAFDFRPGPTVKATLADRKIQIVLTISGGRQIKEITRVSASTTYTQVQGTTGLYSSTPIPGNGNTVTFNTTIDEYKTKTATTADPAVNTELARRFYFLVTLDDGSQVVPSDVRVLIVP